MAIKIGGTSVINDSRQLENITNLKTVGGQSLLGSGNISAGGPYALTVDTKTADYTVIAGDLGKYLNFTGGSTVSLTSAATLGAGFNVTIKNNINGYLTIDPAGSETIDTKSTYSLSKYNTVQLVSDGTNWNAILLSTNVYYKESYNIGEPLPTVSSSGVAIGPGAASSGPNSIAIGTGYGGSSTPSSGNASLAITGGTSSGRESTAIAGAYATADFATAIGKASNSSASVATGAGAFAISGGRATGTDSVSIVLQNPSSPYGATGSSSVAIGAYTQSAYTGGVCIGYMSTAAANYSFAAGYSAYTGGQYSIALGYNCSAGTGPGSTVIGSSSQVLNGCDYGLALGSFASSNVPGKIAISNYRWDTNGDSQSAKYLLRRNTTDATPSFLAWDPNTSSSSSAGSIIGLYNSSIYFTGIVMAKQGASSNTAVWKVEGIYYLGSTASTASLVYSSVTSISNTPGWAATVELVPNTTTALLQIRVTGVAGTNLRWLADINTTELRWA